MALIPTPPLRFRLDLVFLSIFATALSPFSAIQESAIASPLTLSQTSQTTKSEPDFSDTGRSPNPKPLASRGDTCPAIDQEIDPLVPLGQGGGWTTSSAPTIWVHLPFGLDDSYGLQLVVRAPAPEGTAPTDAPVVANQWVMPTTTTPGIHHFSLPLDPAALPLTEAAATDAAFYTWQLEIFCDTDRPAVVAGTLRRVDTDMTAYSGTPSEMSAAYAQEKIWYDALTVLGQARLAEPDNADYAAAWQQLLSYPSVGLEAIATEPIADCCTLTTP